MEKNRATGRTSRLVDSYIQELFNQGEIDVKDHHDDKHSNRYLLERIVDRYEREYNKSNNKKELIVRSLNVKLVEKNG